MRLLRVLLIAALAALAAPAVAQTPRAVSGDLAAESSDTTRNCPSTACLSLPAVGYGSASVQITGTFTATLTFEISSDGINYQVVNAVPAASATPVTTATAAGVWFISVGGADSVRVRISSYTSGTAHATLRPAFASGGGGSGGSGSNAAASSTGAAVPGSADYTGINVSGNLVGATGKAVGTEKAITVAVVDGSGNQITSFGGAGGTASNFNAAIPAQGTAAGISDGTNMQAPRGIDADTGAGTHYVMEMNSIFRTNGTPVEAGTSSNPWNVVFASTQTVNSAQSGNWSLRAQDGSGNALTSQSLGAQRALSVALVDGSGSQLLPSATAANQTTQISHESRLTSSAFATDGSGSLATTGFMAGAVYNATPPSFTDTRQVPLQTDVAGNLKVVDGGTGLATAANQTTTNSSLGATTDAAATAGGTGSLSAKMRLATTQLDALHSDLTGTLAFNLTQIAGNAVLAEYGAGTLQSAAVANGNGTPLSSNGYGTVVMTVNCSSCSGGTTVNFEASEDGTNFFAKEAERVDVVSTAAAVRATSTTTAGLTYWRFNAAGLQAVRARISGYSAGTVTVTGRTVFATTPPTVLAINGIRPNGTNQIIVDPCESADATISTIAISQADDAVIKAGTSSKKTYICGVMIVAGAAETVSFISGTGSVCGTGSAAIIGSTTQANGVSLAANGGFTLPVSKTSWAATAAAADDLCLVQNGTARVSGTIKVAVQ